MHLSRSVIFDPVAGIGSAQMKFPGGNPTFEIDQTSGDFSLKHQQLGVMRDEGKNCIGVNGLDTQGSAGFADPYKLAVETFEPHFVFGHEGTPGEKNLSAHTFWKIHREILKDSGLKKLNTHFTIYSYKHSGVINLYKSSKDIEQVQRQCRHR